MNRLPTKQIYLLFIIIVGIIALSVYSTYALFTFENSTSDIVSIHIPKSLTISENIYEYQQITMAPNTIATTDIDIYNSFDYEVCYSVWYRVIGESKIQNNVQVFEKTDNTLTSSGVLTPTTNMRVTLVIVNDNDVEIKINLGTIGTEKIDGSCSLNITSDKSVVSASYKNVDILTTKLMEETKTTNSEENYLTYKDITETITYKDTDKIYTANNFTYTNELFTLTDSEYITLEELINKNSIQSNDIYFCKESDKCSILYKFEISNIKKNEIEITPGTETTEPEIEISYDITKYDKLIGYSAGENGLRKVNDKDYIYYGDNPNNFIYYNCGNPDDLNTCELWRIIGFFYDEETKKYITKIVRNNSIGAYQFDYKMLNDENTSSNVWNTSTLYKYLTEEYKLTNNYDIYLDEYIDKIERIPDLESDVKNIEIPNETINSKISLLSLSDYLYASSCNKTKINEYTGECLTNNWLNNIEIKKEWTITAKELEVIIDTTPEEVPEITDNPDETLENNEETKNTEENQDNETTNTDEVIENQESTEPVDENNYVINYVYTIGEKIEEHDVNDSYSVRPVVYLKSRILLLDGNGSLESPYVVK